MVAGTRGRFLFFASRNIVITSVLNKNWRTYNQPFCQHFTRLHTSRLLDVSYKKHGAKVTETPSSHKTARSPVVVLLGWNGAKDKHLAKYSEIFTQKNYGIVRVTANPFDTFGRLGTKVKQNGYKVLEVLDHMKCEDRPVILYAFSHGGGAVFFHMMEALTMPQSKYHSRVQVVGTIFDSCPLKLDITGKERMLNSIIESMNNPLQKALVRYGLGSIANFVVRSSTTMARYMDSMKASTLSCNQLVLYSKADRFSPYMDIEDYIGARKSLGVHVVSKCWEDSAHVNHFMEHTDEYLKLVNEFVDECMEE